MIDLPIYDITLEDYNYGVYAVSLVKNPAIKSNFIHFSEQVESVKFMLADEEKREVIGAILIPDVLILREVNGQKFYVKFSSDVIKQINEKMSHTDGGNVFTIQHELDARGTVVRLENWIKESETDKSVSFGIQAPIGTLFTKVKINSDLIWESIKEGKLNGFSVELDSSIIKAVFNAQKENKNMDFKSMYSSSVKVNGTELLFNGELGKSSLLFNVITVGEKDSLVPFSGMFTVNGIEYKVKDALVTEVNDINVNLEEKIAGVVDAISELKTMLTDINSKDEESGSEKLDAILLKLEEAKLSAAQKASESKNEPVALEANFSIETYNVIRNWSNKWSK